MKFKLAESTSSHRLNETGYLDPEKEYYDYGTGTASGTDVIDTSLTGMSYYDQLIPGNSENNYMKENKNLVGNIVYMTPKEYYEQCAKLFNTSVTNLVNQRSNDENSNTHIKNVLLKYKRKLPLPFINWASKGQEGLHRMLVLSQLFGWDKVKFPVLIIDYYDKERQTRLEREAAEREVYNNIQSAVSQSLRYKFENEQEFIDELQWQLNSKFDTDSDVEFQYSNDNDLITVTVNNISYQTSSDYLKIENNEEDDELILDDE